MEKIIIILQNLKDNINNSSLMDEEIEEFDAEFDLIIRKLKELNREEESE